MKRLAVVGIAALVLAPTVHADNAITLDTVLGLADGKIPLNKPVEFRFRVQIDSTLPGGLWYYFNTFRVYSPDGVELDVVFGTYLPAWLPFGEQSILALNLDGGFADTIAFTGEDSAGGFWVEYDEVAWSVTVREGTTAGPGPPPGGTICIDTVAQILDIWPYATWVWRPPIDSMVPDWGGPYCFALGCCNGDGERGNVDYILGTGGAVDVADLNYLVTYLFLNGPDPPCIEEANIDGIIGPGGPIDVADVTHLVGYLFHSGPWPAPCP